MTIEERIKMKLAEHGLGVEFDSKVDGGSVTLYRYEPSVGLKMSKVEKYVKDIEQVVEVSGIRVLAPIPDSSLIGFEVPKKDRVFPGAPPKARGFDIPVGIDVLGQTHTLDIRQAPHMLVAGATGSGKSVFISHLIKHLQNVKGVEMVLLDPKMVELAKFDEAPNVRTYADDIHTIHQVLSELVDEMDTRYKKMQQKGARTLGEYRSAGGRLPYLFVFIDEYGDLIVQNHVEEKQIDTGDVYLSGPRKGMPKIVTEKTNLSKEIKKNILMLAQKARAAGIHIVLTTQRPSTNIVDGAIKANFPTRVSFRTSTALDSSVIIDADGAEKLLGKGDMLLLHSDGSGIVRLQGYSDEI